jgi:hypothetical protein
MRRWPPSAAGARAAGRLDAGRPRAFLEANFRAEPMGGDGLLTAYFAPNTPPASAAAPSSARRCGPSPPTW